MAITMIPVNTNIMRERESKHHAINSVSGGKTSAYLMQHYQADYNIFALVKSSDKLLAPKDKGLTKEIQRRVPDFISTLESDLTLKLLLDLEQFTGREVTFCSSQMTFDDLIKYKKMLPNPMVRFCTEYLKINAIFEYIYMNIFENQNDKIEMRIGFRKDEDHRALEFDITNKNMIKYPTHFRVNSHRAINTDFDWRITTFPLIDDLINKRIVNEYWKDKPLTFPVISNCVGCFFHSQAELTLQWQIEPIKMGWFARQEANSKRQFRKEFSYEGVKETFFEGMTDFVFNQKPCISGFCGV